MAKKTPRAEAPQDGTDPPGAGPAASAEASLTVDAQLAREIEAVRALQGGLTRAQFAAAAGLAGDHAVAALEDPSKKKAAQTSQIRAVLRYLRDQETAAGPEEETVARVRDARGRIETLLLTGRTGVARVLERWMWERGQDAFVEHLGMSRSTLNNWRSGKEFPEYPDLIALAERQGHDLTSADDAWTAEMRRGWLESFEARGAERGIPQPIVLFEAAVQLSGRRYTRPVLMALGIEKEQTVSLERHRYAPYAALSAEALRLVEETFPRRVETWRRNWAEQAEAERAGSFAEALRAFKERSGVPWPAVAAVFGQDVGKMRTAVHFMVRDGTIKPGISMAGIIRVLAKFDEPAAARLEQHYLRERSMVHRRNRGIAGGTLPQRELFGLTAADLTDRTGYTAQELTNRECADAPATGAEDWARETEELMGEIRELGEQRLAAARVAWNAFHRPATVKQALQSLTVVAHKGTLGLLGDEHVVAALEADWKGDGERVVTTAGRQKDDIERMARGSDVPSWPVLCILVREGGRHLDMETSDALLSDWRTQEAAKQEAALPEATGPATRARGNGRRMARVLGMLLEEGAPSLKLFFGTDTDSATRFEDVRGRLAAGAPVGDDEIAGTMQTVLARFGALPGASLPRGQRVFLESLAHAAGDHLMAFIAWIDEMGNVPEEGIDALHLPGLLPAELEEIKRERRRHGA